MSGYFERIEDHLLDAVERRRAATRGRARVAIATAAGLAAIVALALAGLLAAVGGGPDRAALDRPETLNDALAVLRRDQRAGDAPASVVIAAAEAAARARGPLRGGVDTGGVRRLVAGGAASGGLRLYLAPVLAPGSAAPQAPDRAADGAQAALVVLTDADDRPVQYPYGVTVSSLRDGNAWYIAWGLRAETGPLDAAARAGRPAVGAHRTRTIPDGPLRQTRMRSLQIQLVPDGVASVAYRYPPEVGRGPQRATTIEVPVADNAAATVLRADLANRHPAEATMRDGDGETVGRAVPIVRGRGPLAPAAVCRGVELPARAGGRPQIGFGPTTLRDLCRQVGLPQAAYRRDGAYTLVLWRDGTVTGQRAGSAIGAVWHLAPGGEFPPRFADLLPPARKLGRYQRGQRP